MTGLCIHIPYCQHKCSYCDFYSIEKTADIPSFVTTLCKEIRMRAESAVALKEPFTTVFFGGGTPSLVVPSDMERIIRALRDSYAFSDECEWTMECNPGTVTRDSLTAYKGLGMNRLSFGVQSFHESELRFLERIHDASDVVKGVDGARRAGFDNINLDVMFALPGQTEERLSHTLRNIVSLGPEHVSAYSLIYEEGTPLHARLLRGDIRKLPEEDDARMYELTIDFLESQGYRQYEVSSFAKEGHRCRHNLCYWTGSNYLAFGPSAHGYVGDTRYRNVRNISRYMDAVDSGRLPTIGTETLRHDQVLFENVFLGLRSTGVHVGRLMASHGCDVASIIRQDESWMEEE
ncbi:MAG: radical SAM family heme chaperone HemW, partial [Candidatus Kapaibacterium sp.]